jgi:hypothetical protein
MPLYLLDETVEDIQITTPLITLKVYLVIPEVISEKVGFEPTEACTSSDFKSDAIDQLCHLS